MDRRTFLLSTLAAAAAGPALAASGERYKPGLVKAKLEKGEIVFVDFYTDWCTTCRSQQRTINALKAENLRLRRISALSRLTGIGFQARSCLAS